YVNGDREAEWKLWEDQVSLIAEAIKDINSVETNIHVPPIANHVPTLGVSWNPKKVRISGDALKEVLRSGHPSIEVAGGGKDSISITTWMLRPGQEQIVATRLKEALSEVANS
ncbi:MAG: selenocysteine synthase, partial [Cyclobacteriaceae bacterium]